MQRPGRKDRAQSAGSSKGDSRKPYRAPTLTVHGSVKALTRTKRGGKNDGGGKPRTRASGGQG
jgi:hypothetical protein